MSGMYDCMGIVKPSSKFSLPHCHHHGPTAGDPFPEEGAKGCPSESSPKCPKSCDSDAKAPHDTFAKDK
eukprot:gene14120-biopygen1061